MSFEEASPVEVKEVSVLEKFEGDVAPENLVERIHIEDGVIIKVETFEDGELVSTDEVKEVT